MRSRVHAEDSHLCFNEVGPWEEEMETDEMTGKECERSVRCDCIHISHLGEIAELQAAVETFLKMCKTFDTFMVHTFSALPAIMNNAVRQKKKLKNHNNNLLESDSLVRNDSTLVMLKPVTLTPNPNTWQ